jgi:hypothetical protein
MYVYIHVYDPEIIAKVYLSQDHKKGRHYISLLFGN